MERRQADLSLLLLQKKPQVDRIFIALLQEYSTYSDYISRCKEEQKQFQIDLIAAILKCLAVSDFPSNNDIVRTLGEMIFRNDNSAECDEEAFHYYNENLTIQ